MGVDADPLTDSMVVIAAALDDAHSLVVLDNCEHLLPDLASLVEQLVSKSINLRILATSRQSLGLSRERLVRVEPLPIPDDQSTVAQIEKAPAVRLLVESGSLLVTQHNADAVVELCRRTDGLPLALELAAFRLRSAGLDSLTDQDDGGRVERGPVDFRSDHQTLHDAIAASIDGLDETHAWLLDSMSIFAGPVPAEAVVRLVADELDAITVKTLLAGLVDRSLVSMVPVNGIVRYRLLETIRTHCRHRLADGRADAELRLFRLLEQAAISGARRTDLRFFMQHLAGEISVVLDHLEHSGDDDVRHLRFATTVANTWYGAGRIPEARDRLAAALRRYPDGPDFEVGSAKALFGMISFGVGAVDDLARFTSEALDLLEPMGLPGLEFVKATGCVGRGELVEAQQLISTFLGVSGLDARAQLAALEVAATAAWFDGEHERSAARYSDHRQLAEQVDDPYLMGHGLRGRAVMLAYDGRAEAGLALCRDSHSADDQIQHRVATEHHAALAVILHQLGDNRRAGEEAKATLLRCARRFNAHAAAMTVPVLAATYLDRGEPRDLELAGRLIGWFEGLCQTTGFFAPRASEVLLNTVDDGCSRRLGPARWRVTRGQGALEGLASIMADRRPTEGQTLVSE